MGRTTEKLGEISYSSGTQQITMGASRLRVGGGFLSTDGLSVSVPNGSLSAHARYFVYAVNTFGILSLVVSLNPPSLGPAGFSAYRLVKAFHSNEAGNFGVFYSSLSGRPRFEDTLLFTFVPDSTGTPPTVGSSGETFNHFMVDGRFLWWRFVYYRLNPGTQGSGTYKYSLPFGTIDIGKNTVSPSSFVGQNLGDANVVLPSSSRRCMCTVIDQSTLDAIGLKAVDGASDGGVFHGSFHGFGNNSLDISFTAKIPLLELSETPLEDL